MPLRSKLCSSVRAAVISFSPGATATWPSTRRRSQAKALTTCRGEVWAARSNERRSVLPSQCLAINRQYPLTGGTEPLDKAPETRRKGGRVQQPEQTRERVVARRPVLQLEK